MAVCESRQIQTAVRRIKCGTGMEPSTLLHQCGSALAGFLERHFKAAKLLRAQFGKHSLHLPGMLPKGGNNKILAAWGEGNDPYASVFGALDAADQAFRAQSRCWSALPFYLPRLI